VYDNYLRDDKKTHNRSSR